MRLSKRLTDYAKFRDFKLPLRAKPFPVPYKEGRFYPDYFTQILIKKVRWGTQDRHELGLEENTLNKMNDIFLFHSMGYAEFEWQAIGKSWQFLKDNISNVSFGEHDIYGKKMYTVCMKDHMEFMEPMLKYLVANCQFPMRLNKVDMDLHKVIQGDDKNFVGGWGLHLNYVFFANKSKFLKFKKLLKEEAGVK